MEVFLWIDQALLMLRELIQRSANFIKLQQKGCQTHKLYLYRKTQAMCNWLLKFERSLIEQEATKASM